MNTSTCPLTGIKIKPENFLDNSAYERSYSYSVPTIGKAKISHVAWHVLETNNFPHKYIIAGYCRNSFELGGEIPMIDGTFINEGYKSLEYPQEFDEKCLHFLKYLFNKGGNESKTFTLNTQADYPLTYSTNSDEFKRVMDHLELTGRINWKSRNDDFPSRTIFFETRLTLEGIEEAKKNLPVDPMIRLVREEFESGEKDIDQKINHAIKLFHSESSIDNMRSACETLSFILEPLRAEMKVLFKGDTEDFFILVNNFNIRHNKERTKKIEHPEQLEWIFYSLLNTIRTFYKIKTK